MKFITQLKDLSPEWNSLIAYEIHPFEDRGEDDKIYVGKDIRISFNFFRLFIIKIEFVINYFWR